MQKKEVGYTIREVQQHIGNMFLFCRINLEKYLNSKVRQIN